jgi:hypothetical protein
MRPGTAWDTYYCEMKLRGPVVPTHDDYVPAATSCTGSVSGRDSPTMADGAHVPDVPRLVPNREDRAPAACDGVGIQTIREERDEKCQSS